METTNKGGSKMVVYSYPTKFGRRYKVYYNNEVYSNLNRFEFLNLIKNFNKNK